MAPTDADTLESWSARLMREDPPRSKSLIMTIFGDSLLPLVSGVWLAELNVLLDPFGMNAQLARTSAFRLAEEGWLQSRREGRASRYALTASGRDRVQRAYHRVYDPPPQSWDGNWTLVLPADSGADAAARAALRRELEWEGFGRAANKLFLHPRPDEDALRGVLERHHMREHVSVFRGQTLPQFGHGAQDTLPSACWDLEAVAERYAAFTASFTPARTLLGDADAASASAARGAFLVQTLLIHAFRRVVLHDPRLPSALLPEDWPGHAAYALCRDIYRRTHAPARAWLTQQLPEAHTGTPPAEFLQRFGGL